MSPQVDERYTPLDVLLLALTLLVLAATAFVVKHTFF